MNGLSLIGSYTSVQISDQKAAVPRDLPANPSVLDIVRV